VAVAYLECNHVRGLPAMRPCEHSLTEWLYMRMFICRVGMRAGFQMRLQAIAAVQAKVLRLNSVAVADVSPGKVGRFVA